MSADKPVLKLGLGRTSEEINSESTLKINKEGNIKQGGWPYFFAASHIFVYEDDRLHLTLPDSGAKVSMPTSIMMMDDRLEAVYAASVIGEYVPIDSAVTRVETLLADIRSQGFQFDDDKYARFAVLTSYPANGVKVPQSLAGLGDIASFFLNADYCAAEMIVFILVKQGLQVQLRLKNMRRAFPSGPKLAAAIRADEVKLSDQKRRTERVYYLQLSITEQAAKKPS